MKKPVTAGLAILISLTLCLPTAASAAANDKTTRYRVYQNDRLLTESADYNNALNTAKSFSHSHVEEIGSRKWLWDNYPRYQVYQLDATLPNWTFSSLKDAQAEAAKWGYASVKDLEAPGWVWNNYPRYRVYQGDITLDSWEFTTRDDAVQEAKRWGESHIIDLNDNRWVWDNISSQRKQELRSGSPIYQVFQGNYTTDSWKFSYLEDAVNEALKWGGSTVVNTQNGNKTVYSNIKRYQVYQSNTFLDAFSNLDDAITYARLWAGASIRLNDRSIWNNNPTYTIFQNETPIGGFNTIPGALQYAVQYSSSSIRRSDGVKIWNSRQLLFWGWNGMANNETIRKQTASTAGLDMDSPSWFQLADADGNLKDTSTKETADFLKQQGFKLHPLVTNQFDAALTSQFLANTGAQEHFIRALVDRAAELQADGINVDFESLRGSDRAAFTEFITKLTAYAHEKGLKISVDLPRGSIKWNHQTAYDHEKLAGIVDYIITMTYDQYYTGSPSPGSVAGIQWVEQGVQEFLSYGIPRDKLLIGIPFYVREWTLDANGGLAGNRAVYTKDLSSLIESKNPTATWDDQFNQYRMEYTDDNGQRRVFWLENDDTVKARIDIAKKYELAGLAAWRLGQEPQQFWQTMIKEK